MAFGLIVVGGGIGVLVGLSGMGGASLLVPVLVLMGWPFSTVVRTALVFNLGTKGAALTGYARRRDVDWRWVARIAIGGVPAAAFGSAVASLLTRLGIPPEVWRVALAVTLSLAGLVTATKACSPGALARVSVLGVRWPPPARAAAIVAFGVVLGLSVGLTAVGAGALVAPVLQWRARLPLRSVVGTDLAVGIALTAVAAALHGLHLAAAGPTASLLLGSIPGTWLGRRWGTALPQRSLSLVLSGLVMLSGVLLL
jgi:uncharacterized membrane protein YfcA